MQLKKDIIEKFVLENDLIQKEPSEILQKLSIQYKKSLGKVQKGGSQGNRYFFESLVKQSSYRKSLKKKFDNIVNIDIKPKLRSRDSDFERV